MENNQYALSITANTAIEMAGKVIANTAAYSLYVAGSVVVIDGLSAIGTNGTDITLLAVGYAYGAYFGFPLIKNKLINPLTRSISNLITSVIPA